MASVLMTALVWLIELVTHHAINPSFGNAWGPYSGLQLLGFGLVVVALLVYDGSIIRIPRLFTYPPADVVEVKSCEEVSITPGVVCSASTSTDGVESY